jgi:hypothetical protein
MRNLSQPVFNFIFAANTVEDVLERRGVLLSATGILARIACAAAAIQETTGTSASIEWTPSQADSERSVGIVHSEGKLTLAPGPQRGAIN